MRINSHEELRNYLPGLDRSRPQAEAVAGSSRSGRVAFNPYPGDLPTAHLAPPDTIEKEVREDPERKRLYDAAVEFQAVFLNMMLKSMRSTLNREQDILHGGRTQEIFEDMLYDEYSRTLSRTERFGLAEEIYRQFSRPPSGSVPESQVESKQRLNEMRDEARAGYAREMLPVR